MKILEVRQGTPEWLAARAKHFCASDAPAMMGVSPYMTRTELLRLKATGNEREFSEWQQRHLLDKGHEDEANARSIIEAEIGEELYPATATDDAGYLLASFDGLTMDEGTGYEHKIWNKDLATQVRAKELGPMHYWQLEQQILIAGLNRVIFVCSNGTPEKLLQMEYRPVPGRVEQLLAGWKQFAEDLKNYQHVAAKVAPAGAPVVDLPAVSVRVSGQIAIADNFKVFEKALRDFIDNRLIRKPQTDQDFADLDTQIKSLKKAEDALNAAETAMLAQVSSIDAMKRTKDMLYKLARDNRLVAERLLEAEKANRREEIRREGADAYAAHITKLHERLGKPYIPLIGELVADFAGAMRGKKTIDSLKDAVATELARVKIAANDVADRIQINLIYLREHAKDHAFLFADTAQIVLKATDDLATLVKMRIAEHKAAEQKRLDEERERIRQEEAAKLAAQQPSAPAPAPHPPMPAASAPQPASGKTPAADRRELARQNLIAFIEEFGDLKELATIIAAIRAYLNASGRKRKAAA